MMKYTSLICFLLSFLFLFNIVNAQKKNHINIDPFLPIFGTVQIQYERPVYKNVSFRLSVGWKTSSGIFKVKGFNTNRISTDDFNFKGIKIIPEFRWYVQNPDVLLSGFYIGNYFKYQNYKDKIEGVYTDRNQGTHDFRIDAKMKTYAVGLQIGYKLMIMKRFFIDFIIAGPGVSFNTFKLEEKEGIPDAFYDDVSNVIANYSVLENFDTDFEFNLEKKTGTIVLPAFRYGMKLGYTF